MYCQVDYILMTLYLSPTASKIVKFLQSSNKADGKRLSERGQWHTYNKGPTDFDSFYSNNLSPKV